LPKKTKKLSSLSHLDQLLVGFDALDDFDAQGFLLDAGHKLADDGQGDLCVGWMDGVGWDGWGGMGWMGWDGMVWVRG
jgi:hypothetical protein